MFKIALNAGHGINTSGKRCLKSIDPNETREWVLNSRICNKIEEKLKSYTGYELIRLDDTSGNTDVPLKQRTDKANKFGADFYLSIHHNAGIKGGNGAVQLGAGQVYGYGALQVVNHLLLKTDGTIPPERITSQNWTDAQRLAVLLSLGCTVDENGFVKWTATPSE